MAQQGAFNPRAEHLKFPHEAVNVGEESTRQLQDAFERSLTAVHPNITVVQMLDVVRPTAQLTDLFARLASEGTFFTFIMTHSFREY